MNRIEKTVLFCALIAQVVVIALGIHDLGSEPPGPSSVPSWMKVLTVLVSLAAVVLVFRDLYERQFPNPNAKITWVLIMAFTGGIGIVIYALRHAVRPRSP